MLTNSSDSADSADDDDEDDDLTRTAVQFIRMVLTVCIFVTDCRPWNAFIRRVALEFRVRTRGCYICKKVIPLLLSDYKVGFYFLLSYSVSRQSKQFDH